LGPNETSQEFTLLLSPPTQHTTSYNPTSLIPGGLEHSSSPTTHSLNLKMIDKCKHHAHCGRPAPRRLRQRKLVITDGILCLDSRALYKPRRKPAGKAVRNIANTATFSTTDPSLTSFLRFPPEVRIQIYGYLLLSHQNIQYGICPVTQCLVWRKSIWRRWIRHGLFPAILECCRTINEEGSAILYLQNSFMVEYFRRSCPVVAVWSPARANLFSITRLRLVYMRDECLQDLRTPETLDLFPALQEVKIWLQNVLVGEWTTFLGETSVRLQRLKKFMLQIHVSDNPTIVIWNQWPGPLITDEERCLRAYQGPFLKEEDIWKGRRVKWEFDPEPDLCARSHAVLGDLRVLVESN
jgi:hypothetical protein